MRYNIPTLLYRLSAFIFLLPSIEAAVAPPACQPAAAPAQLNLSNVTTALVPVRGKPFAVISALLQKDIAFVSLSSANSSTIGILDTSTFAPTVVGQIDLPHAFADDGALGLALTSDGKYLFVATSVGALVVDTAAAVAGNSSDVVVVGELNGTTTSQSPGSAAIEVTLSQDDQYAFVSQEYGDPRVKAGPGNVDVFKLNFSDSSVTGSPIGFVSLGRAVVGSALSSNGSELYVTSELMDNSTTGEGLLSVLDVATLETDPAQSVRANVSAGCSPVREIVSQDGQVIWITARESNRLLAFNASTFASQPANESLIASVEVGTSPVGLTFVRNGTRILTADSNRFLIANATTGISVVDVEAALAGSSQAVLGRIPTGSFPRDFAVSPDGGTVLVACYNSSQIQAIDVTTLP